MFRKCWELRFLLIMRLKKLSILLLCIFLKRSMVIWCFFYLVFSLNFLFVMLWVEIEKMYFLGLGFFFWFYGFFICGFFFYFFLFWIRWIFKIDIFIIVCLIVFLVGLEGGGGFLGFESVFCVFYGVDFFGWGNF